jgi:hypothetical protein
MPRSIDAMETVERQPRPASRRDTERYMHMAMFVDILHMPLVIGLVVMGALAWWGPVFITILTIVVVIQIALLGCPCMLLSGWLRRKHLPDYEPRWSVTVWLYQRYGVWVGVGVFVFFLLAALGVRALLV